MHQTAELRMFKGTPCGKLTHCILLDYSIVVCWWSPFVIEGLLGLFCCFYSISDGKSY